MLHAIRTTVAVEHDDDRQALQDACFAAPSIALTGVIGVGAEHLGFLGQQPDDAVLVCTREPSEALLEFVRGAVAQRPERPVVVVQRGSGGVAREVLEAGAEDLVSLPPGVEDREWLAGQLAFALEKAVVRRETVGAASPAAAAPGAQVMPLAVAPPPPRAEVVTVLGPKGGIGKTVTACNLAVSLVRAGRRVVVVDLDLQFGDLGLALGIKPERTIYDLAVSGGSLDAEKLDAYMAHHPSWLRVLPAPTRPDQAGAITPEFLGELFEALRDCTDHVIVDTPAGFPPEVIAAIDAADQLCVVASMDAFALKNAKLALETLHLMDVAEERVRVVLNRSDTRLGLAFEDVESILGRPADICIPSSRDVVRSINEAAPIAGHTKGEASKAFRDLAACYLPVEEQKGRTKRWPFMLRKAA